jgi:hypothetical protein
MDHSLIMMTRCKQSVSMAIKAMDPWGRGDRFEEDDGDVRNVWKTLSRESQINA